MPTSDDRHYDLVNNCKKPWDLSGEAGLISHLFRTTLQTTKQRGRKERQEKNNDIIADQLHE